MYKKICKETDVTLRFARTDWTKPRKEPIMTAGSPAEVRTVYSTNKRTLPLHHPACYYTETT